MAYPPGFNMRNSSFTKYSVLWRPFTAGAENAEKTKIQQDQQGTQNFEIAISVKYLDLSG
jgi:hypothetical protein